ncbi:unnamed protein product [Penicillium salamii]|nr:unnamed protein product [Penicillium salamii]
MSDSHINTAFSLIENDESKVLTMTIGKHENVQPGARLPRKDAQDPPKLSFTGAKPDTKYVVVSLDIDAPFPSFGVLGPILHWIQSDVKVTESFALEFDAPFIANWIGPAPPPGSAPHRYIFFLYEQPDSFDLKDHAPADGKALSNWNRMRYDLDAWAEQAKLGPPVAFNYFSSILIISLFRHPSFHNNNLLILRDSFNEMTTDKSVKKLTDSLKELVIGASGKIPGFLHDIKRLVEECGAKFVDAEGGIKDCTHLITTIRGVHGSYKKVTLADSEGCYIVTMDWLLKTLKKKAPQKVQKYLLKRIKLKNFIETTPSKRGREDDSGEEDNASSKKTALFSKRDSMDTIRQHNFQTLSDLVDYNFEDSNEVLTVWLDDSGFLWDVILVKFDEQYGAAKFMRIQILHSHYDDSGPSVWLCRYHSTIAVKDIDGEHYEESFEDFASTRIRFRKAFRKFTGLSWDRRDSDPLVDHWIFLKMSHGMAPLGRETEQVIPEVLAVLKMIFGAEYLAHYTASLTARGYGFSFTTPEDKVWFRIALACMEMDLKLRIDNTKSETRNVLERMIQSMVSGSAVSVFNIPSVKAGNFNFDARVFESFELLLKLQDAFDIMENSDDPEMSLSQIYHGLGLAKMNLGDGERFSEWQKADVSRKGDRRLLWHGSGCANFAGILTQGLRGGGLVSPNGKPFLPGIYFADMSTKSAGYSGSTANKECLIMLCEVELGVCETVAGRRVGATTHNAWRTAGYIHPDFKNVRVPDVNAGRSTNTGSGLFHCEYIAHDPAQVIQRYLFHIKLK